MDWHIHYYIYLMSRRVDCMVSDNDDEISEHGSLRFSRIIIQDKNIENSLVSVCCASLNVLFSSCRYEQVPTP